MNAAELQNYLQFWSTVNQQRTQGDEQPIPLCIWGPHGVGKTAVVEDWARSQNWPLVYLAPAQLEEMGDLLGMPAVVGERTVFRRPDWAPDSPGPGILLIDDVNRAEERILRGMMQLWQRHGVLGWHLPERWYIVLTANPDRGDYSLTPLDPAMLTRLWHARLHFDAPTWAAWALQTGIEPGFVRFVTDNPHLVDDQRTTARTLTYFFQSLRSLSDPVRNLVRVRQLGLSFLDETAVEQFTVFLQQGGHYLPDPARLLTALDVEKEVIGKLRTTGQEGRLVGDRIAAFHRLLLQRIEATERLDKRALENLVAYLTTQEIDRDARLLLLRDLYPLAAGKQLRQRAELADLILDMM